MTDGLDALDDEGYINSAIRDAINETYLRRIVETTPFKTGHTSGLWELENPEPLVFNLVNPAGDVVLALEHGTGEHIIEAKTKKFLKFKKPKLGGRRNTKKLTGNIAFESKDHKFVFAKKVLHPGFEGRRFIEKMLDDEALAKEFEKKLEKYLGL